MRPEEARVGMKVDYYLDESDPDIVILRRQDASFVAAFSAIGATKITGNLSGLNSARLTGRARNTGVLDRTLWAPGSSSA